MAVFDGSNAVIKSNGVRHWVEVDGVQLKGVAEVDVKYMQGEIVRATIVILNPKIDNRAERR